MRLHLADCDKSDNYLRAAELHHDMAMEALKCAKSLRKKGSALEALWEALREEREALAILRCLPSEVNDKYDKIVRKSLGQIARQIAALLDPKEDES